MSINTYVEVVPFKIEVEEADIPPDYRGYEGTVAGWYFCMDILDTIGEIDFEVISKGRLTVLALNESDGAMVGCVEQTFVARTKKELVQFCKDWGFDPRRIRKNAAVKRTI